MIAVASGKGGVGKTTVSVNLAAALRRDGLRVGLVDADIYGPDVGRMLGLRRARPARSLTLHAAAKTPGARLEPLTQHGIQVVSAAFLVGDAQGLGLAAGLAHLLLRRLIWDTVWDRVDCLVVDLPPGTADLQQAVFTLGDLGVLVVVTPEEVAHLDTGRILTLLESAPATLLGGVENLAGFCCPHCGAESPIHPPAEYSQTVWSRGLDKLVSVPFTARPVVVDGDGGTVWAPVVVAVRRFLDTVGRTGDGAGADEDGGAGPR